MSVGVSVLWCVCWCLMKSIAGMSGMLIRNVDQECWCMLVNHGMCWSILVYIFDFTEILWNYLVIFATCSCLVMVSGCFVKHAASC